MADIRQAEKWEDIIPYVKRLLEASSRMPAPPVPDDDYAQKRNELNRVVEGLNELIRGRADMENFNS